MDYEKKYKEALVKAEEFYNDKDNIQYANAEGMLEEIFPELKESEDEKIRKYLIRYIGNTMKSSELKSKLLAWLEKQGKQKSIWHNEDEEPQKDSLILLIMQSGTPIVAKIIEPNHTFNHGEKWAYIDDLLDKQRKQKPAEWNEDDNSIISDLLDYFDEDKCLKHEVNDIVKWLKTIKPQQKGWGENEIKMLDNLITYLDGKNDLLEEIKRTYIDWLKSLRFQNHWKPSEEQKPTWSEEDENRINHLIAYFEDKEGFTAEDDIEYANWLKNLKERIGG